MTNCGCEFDAEPGGQRRVLIVLLAINAFMFLVEVGFGVIAESMGLIADSLDMLADAAVYGIGLYAVGKATKYKIRAAHLSGLFQIFLGVVISVEIIRRVIWGSEPEPLYMMWVSCLALSANVVCLKLISRFRDGEVHMRASWIFSRNDVVANIGVILSGLLVYVLDSRWPDLIIGGIIVSVVIRGGISILKEAANEQFRSQNPSL